MRRLRQRLSDERGFNVVEMLVFAAVVAVFILLIFPLLHGGNSEKSENTAAQTELTTAVARASSALNNNFTGITPTVMATKAPEFKWRGDTPPTSPKNISIGAESSGNTVVLCNQSATFEYFCVKSTSGSKAYGASYSYYEAETTQLAAWPTS